MDEIALVKAEYRLDAVETAISRALGLQLSTVFLTERGSNRAALQRVDNEKHSYGDDLVCSMRRPTRGVAVGPRVGARGAAK